MSGSRMEGTEKRRDAHGEGQHGETTGFSQSSAKRAVKSRFDTGNEMAYISSQSRVRHHPSSALRGLDEQAICQWPKSDAALL